MVSFGTRHSRTTLIQLPIKSAQNVIFHYKSFRDDIFVFSMNKMDLIKFTSNKNNFLDKILNFKVGSGGGGSERERDSNCHLGEAERHLPGDLT